MNDLEFVGCVYEWDIVGLFDFWWYIYNYIYYIYINVLGKDDDVGYGVVCLFLE